MFYLKGGTVILGHDAAETRIYDRVFCSGAVMGTALTSGIGRCHFACARAFACACMCVLRG